MNFYMLSGNTILGDYMSDFSKSYKENIKTVSKRLRLGESYDIILKKIKLADREAALFCLDGFLKDEMLEKNLEYFTKLTAEDMKRADNAQKFVDTYTTYVEANVVDKLEDYITFVLSGAVGMIVEGFTEAVIIDSRTYPARTVEEPESDKVLRGSHEGFVETIIFNTALIRRKIRNTNLTIKSYQIGSESKTDITVCYLEDVVDRRQLDALTKKLESIEVKSLPMSHESLRECLLPTQLWNPFPKVRYTERPDAAAACIYDGNIIVLTDGSPTAMIFPTGIFDFIQDINDFYFAPVIGSLLRFIRTLVFALSMVFIPVWYLLIQYEESLPDVLKFMLIEEKNTVPIIVQLLIIEFVIDTLRLASVNTPSALSSSFSVVGALVLGEFAVRSGWFVAEVVLFMAFVAISNFTQPSYELGYAIKISRTVILILTALFKIWGFAAGLILVMLVIAFTETISGYTYLYPLIPFNKEALKTLLFRHQIKFRYKK
ncbi:MAG: spore germination protein [Ruminococcaceae bacterium]|nr:spore germination protein [Oscillospiraceae bacterium]